MMATNTNNYTAESETKVTDLPANDTDNENSDEGSNDSDNESSNESAMEYENVMTVSDDFDSLCWYVFGGTSHIQVYSDPSNKCTSSLSLFHGHPIEKAPATSPPCHKLAFSIETRSYIETPGYKKPRRLVVLGIDGGIVTISDVVEQLSPYIRANKEDIFWVLGPTIQFDPPLSPYQDTPVNTNIWSSGFSFGVIEEEYYSIGVELDGKRA
ncbi:hypothetical protein Ptr902_02355 [Pyrenophora tritici-repentis]|nr:hypothetical protein Ptr902_02355 [Pyrenophora tritici-repentis]